MVAYLTTDCKGCKAFTISGRVSEEGKEGYKVQITSNILCSDM